MSGVQHLGNDSKFVELRLNDVADDASLLFDARVAFAQLGEDRLQLDRIADDDSHLLTYARPAEKRLAI